MNAQEFWKKEGRERVKAVCEKAGTKYSYFEHIKNGFKRPSVDLALALVKASNGAMTFEELLIPKTKMRGHKAKQ